MWPANSGYRNVQNRGLIVVLRTQSSTSSPRPQLARPPDSNTAVPRACVSVASVGDREPGTHARPHVTNRLAAASCSRAAADVVGDPRRRDLPCHCFGRLSSHDRALPSSCSRAREASYAVCRGVIRFSSRAWTAVGMSRKGSVHLQQPSLCHVTRFVVNEACAKAAAANSAQRLPKH
jgi:hypothetical protein